MIHVLPCTFRRLCVIFNYYNRQQRTLCLSITLCTYYNTYANMPSLLRKLKTYLCICACIIIDTCTFICCTSVFYIVSKLLKYERTFTASDSPICPSLPPISTYLSISTKRLSPIPLSVAEHRLI